MSSPRSLLRKIYKLADSSPSSPSKRDNFYNILLGNYEKELTAMYEKRFANMDESQYTEKFNKLFEKMYPEEAKPSRPISIRSKKSLVPGLVIRTSRTTRSYRSSAYVGGADKRKFLVQVHVTLHVMIALLIFGGMYLFYKTEGLDQTNCFAWYSSIMSQWRRTPIQNTYCNILVKSINTVSDNIRSITNPVSISHFLPNVFAFLFSVVVGQRMMANVFRVYNSKVLKLTCALMGENYLTAYPSNASSSDAATQDIFNMIVSMINKVASAPAVVAAAPAVAFDASKLAPRPATAAPARSASRTKSAAKSALSEEEFEKELEEAFEEMDRQSSSGESSSQGTGSSGPSRRVTRASARRH